MTALIIIAVLVLIVLWGIGIQRRLVQSDELCKNSLSQIGVQQNSRWDAITALGELIKSYNQHEYQTLKDVISMRKPVDGNSSVEELNANEEAIGKALSSINVVVEQYPELKANEQYLKAMDSVNTYENQVRLARMTYNDSVTKFNREVRVFPDSVVAGLLRFTPKEYLKEPVGKTDMPSLNIPPSGGAA